MVDKRDWSAFIKLCMWAEPFPSQVVARFGLAWSGRDSHRDYCYPGISFYVRLASGGGLSYGSPAAASDRPSHLDLAILVCSQPC